MVNPESTTGPAPDSSGSYAVLPDPAECQPRDDETVRLNDMSKAYITGMIALLRFRGEPVPVALSSKRSETGPLFPARNKYLPDIPEIHFDTSLVTCTGAVRPQAGQPLRGIDIPSEV